MALSLTLFVTHTTYVPTVEYMAPALRIIDNNVSVDAEVERRTVSPDANAGYFGRSPGEVVAVVGHGMESSGGRWAGRGVLGQQWSG